jgi:hypothetical protein
VRSSEALALADGLCGVEKTNIAPLDRDEIKS